MARPQKQITDEHLRQIEMLAGYGLTEAAIARVIGLSPRTFRYKKNEARVSAALQKGKSLAEATVAKALYEKARDGDNTAMIFWLKARAGWKEATIHEHVGEGGGPVEVTVTHRVIDAGEDRAEP